jgi:hypothetical protein
MKKFPSVEFDFKAEDQTKNLKALVKTALVLREDGHTWTAIEEVYKASKYAEHIGWQKVYKASSTAEKGQLPAPVKPPKAPKGPIEIKLEDTISVSNPEAQAALRKLIADDLARGESSVILQEIQKFMISTPPVAKKKK